MPLPVREMEPILTKPPGVVVVATGATMFPVVLVVVIDVSISKPMAPAVLLLAIEPWL